MIKNIFLDRLKPIYFKEEIPIIYLDKLQEDEKFPCKYVLKNIIKYSRNEKVYQIKSSKKQNLLLKIIVFENNELKEYFIHKGKGCSYSNLYLEFLINNKIISKTKSLLFKVDKFQNNTNEQFTPIHILEKFFYSLKTSNINLFNNMEKDLRKNHKNIVMSVIYKYCYIKGTNGEKELLPIETKVNNKLTCNQIISLFDYFNMNINYFNSIEYYFNYKDKKKTKYEKILYYIFKKHRNSYFNLLNDDLKRLICSFL
jgi:hypothetical protein